MFTMPVSDYRDECLNWRLSEELCDWLIPCLDTMETEEELSDSCMSIRLEVSNQKSFLLFFLSKEKQYAVNEKKTLEQYLLYSYLFIVAS